MRNTSLLSSLSLMLVGVASISSSKGRTKVRVLSKERRRRKNLERKLRHEGLKNMRRGR